MSKLFANTLIKEQNLDLEQLREAILSVPVRIRYTDYNKSYHITSLNTYFYIKSSGQEVEQEDFAVFEPDLLKMVSFDELLTDDSKKDLGQDTRFIKEVEKDGTELAINHYWNISFIQRFFTLTKLTLKKVKKQRHLWKLGREKSPWIALTPIPANRHGGRPFGSKTKLTDEEHERLLGNLERYDSIVKKYIEKGIIDRFVELHKDLRKLPAEELPEALNKRFMKSEEGIRYYYFALRYEYKVSIGVPEGIINPCAEDIAEKAKKYDFPFKYKGMNLDELVENYDFWTTMCVKHEDKATFLANHRRIGFKLDLPQQFRFVRKGDKVIELLYEIMCSDYYDTELDDPDAVRTLYYYSTANNPIFKKYYYLVPKRYIEYKQKQK